MRRHRVVTYRTPWLTFGLGLALTGAVGFGVASCSGDENGANSGSTGGTGATTVTSTPVPDGLTATAACARYLYATCERRNECLGTSTDCYANTDGCPDVLFSDGSTRTPEAVWACADVMAVRSCEDVATGTNPDCVTPGTRQLGEACINGTQCASLACSGSTSACGACIDRATAGAACSATLPCVSGLICDGTCVEPTEALLANLLANAPLSLGAACNSSSICVDGAYCALLEEQTTGTCTTRLAEGTYCEQSADCAEGTYCSIDTVECATLPAPGARCGRDRVLNVYMWCDASGYCDASTEVCAVLPTAGSTCATTSQLGGALVLCDANSYCDSTLASPTCTALLAAGATCTSEICAAGLSCLCDDEACTTSSCGQRRDFGESCTAVGDHCPVKIGSCNNGLCEASGSQNLLASLCGG